VWIPRYKYKVWNITKTVGTDSYDAYNTGIDIVFESGTESTGTIKCNAYNFSITNGSLSETCSGTNGSYYTHPAFTFGDDELTGIWVGKFESSSGGNSNIRIKPNVNPWRDETVDYFSYVIQNMQESNNEYGLSTDKTKVDSHMMKNIEWGVVTYFTNSDYGRCSNNSCVEVGMNSYISGSTFKTGCGPQSSGSVSSGSTCNAYTTTLGKTASTTGNVYGIYDVSGGASEYIMANSSSTSGQYTYNAAGAGSNYTYSTTTAKYIDTYAYISYLGSVQTGANTSRLGDATGEIMLSASWNAAWYTDYSEFIYVTDPWYIRGGYYGNEEYTGIFRFGTLDGDAASYYTARTILVSLQ